MNNKKSLSPILRLIALSLAVLTMVSCSKQNTPETIENQQSVNPEKSSAKISILVEGSNFHGIHGITTDSDGNIYVGSVVGMNIHKVNPKTAEVSLYQAAPEGQADDLEFSDDGVLAWTAFTEGKVFSRDLKGNLKVLAQGLPGINSIAYNQEGRLFATQVFLGDALYEIDRDGIKPPRKIIEGMGGLNGFDFGPDGKLYGPLWFKGQVAQVDVDSGELKIISDGFTVPAAVNFDSKGILHVIDNETGEIFQVDIATGGKTLIATAPSNLDNLAFDDNDNLYITNMSDNAIYHVNRDSGETRLIVGGALTTPAGIDILDNTLYIADTFSLSLADTKTGKVSDISRIISDHEYPVAVSATAKTIVNASTNAGFVQGHDRSTFERKFRWTGFAAPSGILAREDGSVIVAETGSGKILLVKGQNNRKVLAENLAEPIGLAEDVASNIYFSEAASGTIKVIDHESGEVTTWVQGLNGPEGIEFDINGLLIVAEVGARQLISIDTNKEKTVIATELPIGLKGYPMLPASFLPTGISVDAENKIYLSSDIDNSILVIER
ncbi:MAG: sugar lactone lactonase YvrE [Oceanicoccus sp.]|jgi:sugar lactone lactonase YvrE